MSSIDLLVKLLVLNQQTITMCNGYLDEQGKVQEKNHALRYEGEWYPITDLNGDSMKLLMYYNRLNHTYCPPCGEQLLRRN